MKRILSPTILLLGVLFFGSCQKKHSSIVSENQTAPTRSDNSGGCRLTTYHYHDAISGVQTLDRFTYRNGLVDEWTISNGWIVKIEYNVNGRMKGAAVFDNGVQISRVEFVWEKSKIVKELWYDGNTDIANDEWINTYDSRGNMIKNESPSTGLYTLYTYEQTGQLKSWEFFAGDMPIVKGEYTSNLRYKNPFKSANGVEYVFLYSNAGVFSSQAWFASEKITYYDFDGNPFVYYDLDPQQTVWHVGQQSYPQHVEYTDILSDGNVYNTFEYENCIPGEPQTKAAQNNSRNPTRRSDSVMSILRGPKTELKNKLTEFRNRHFND